MDFFNFGEPKYDVVMYIHGFGELISKIFELILFV
jgi:hypothetical protein